LKERSDNLSTGFGRTTLRIGTGHALFANRSHPSREKADDEVSRGTPGPGGRSAQNDIGEATRQALSGVRDRVEAGGASMEHAVKCTVFLVDMGDYQGMNEAYVEFFPGSPPARAAVAVLELPAGAQVEVECIAAVPN